MPARTVAAVEELVLQTSEHRRVVRVGNTVRRPMMPWSASVHALLLHLEAVGYRYSPRFLGIDGVGREVLSFIEGSAGADGYVEGIEKGADSWAMVVPESGLRKFGAFLREYHDAVVSFDPPADTVWVDRAGPPMSGQTLCHGDFGPWNVVWRNNCPIGLIDWDYAYPGSPFDDIAYALEFCAPFRTDDQALRWLRYSVPPNRRRRIEIVLEAYGGLDDLPISAVIDGVIARQNHSLHQVEMLAGRGLQPQVSLVSAGHLDRLHRQIRWSEQHRSLIESFPRIPEPDQP